MSLTEAHLEPTRMTMLALVQSLWHQCSAEEDVVARALALVESGRVTLTGNFRDDSRRGPSSNSASFPSLRSRCPDH